MLRWLHALEDWFSARRREWRRERYFRALRQRHVGFGAGFDPPPSEYDRQRSMIGHEATRHAHASKEGT